MQPLYVLSTREAGVWKTKIHDPVSGSASPICEAPSYYAGIGKCVRLFEWEGKRRFTFITCGTRTHGNGESAHHWWLLNGRLKDNEIEDILIDLGITETYRGPGEFFQDGASWRRSPHHTLITQRVGWDV